eukprot:4545392-Amphidinium_carterae.1
MRRLVVVTVEVSNPHKFDLCLERMLVQQHSYLCLFLWTDVMPVRNIRPQNKELGDWARER